MWRLLAPAGWLVTLLALAAHARSSDLRGKQLVEFGWDEPDPAFLRAHIGEMQRTPFDGCAFHVNYASTNGAKGSFTWESWGRQAFTATDLRAALADLRATRFGRFKANFLRFNTTPGKLDWFDDYSAVVANAKLAAQMARAGRCPGLLLDVEQYEGPLFNYLKQRDAVSKSWALYAAQARVRGNELMQALQGGYPGLSVFLTFGYSLPWAESQGGKIALANCEYGLLAPFLDGLVQAARSGTRIIDGHETAYGYRSPAQFESASREMTAGVLPIVRDPGTYQRVFALAFGLWLDKDWRKQPWDTTDFSRNYFSPELLENSVRAALRASDRYVWIYSETPRWWSEERKSQKVPDAYDSALRRARTEATAAMVRPLSGP